MAKRSLLATVAILLLVPSVACSQAYPLGYPLRPLRLIVPSAPGGSPDINARELANKLGKQMNRQVVDRRQCRFGASELRLIVVSAPRLHAIRGDDTFTDQTFEFATQTDFHEHAGGIRSGLGCRPAGCHRRA